MWANVSSLLMLPKKLLLPLLYLLTEHIKPYIDADIAPPWNQMLCLELLLCKSPFEAQAQPNNGWQNKHGKSWVNALL